MVRIKWLKSAKGDLKGIYDFISLDSKKHAKLQIEKIHSKTQILKVQIELGKVVEEMKDPKIREIIEGNYRIIYRVMNENELHILMIHHGARNLMMRRISE